MTVHPDREPAADIRTGGRAAGPEVPAPRRSRPRLPSAEGNVIPAAERSFFVEEFRGITIVISLPVVDERVAPIVADVVAGFRTGDTRLVLVVADRVVAASLVERVGEDCRLSDAADADHAGWLAELWLAATDHRTVVVSAGGDAVDLTAARLAAGLRAAKVVFTDLGGGWGDPPRSFADLAVAGRGLSDALAGRGLDRLLPAMETALAGGAFSVNLCRADDLDAELFTFDGAGTLFTRGGYVQVTDLRVDDLPAVEALIAQGVADGVLRPRNRAQIAELAVHGLGARVIRTGHLAGVVGLEIEPYRSHRVAEVSGLVTVSQFAGFGAGGLLLDGLVQRSRRLDLTAIFAVTVSDRAATFFVRCGFTEVSTDEVPDAKWQGYDVDRRQRARAFWRSVD